MFITLTVAPLEGRGLLIKMVTGTVTAERTQSLELPLLLRLQL